MEWAASPTPVLASASISSMDLYCVRMSAFGMQVIEISYSREMTPMMMMMMKKLKCRSLTQMLSCRNLKQF